MIPILAPKAEIGIRFGNPTFDSVTLVVQTWTGNQDVIPDNNDIIIDVPGVGVFTLPATSMQEVGLDNPDVITPGTNDLLDRVGYVGNIVIFPLPAFPNRSPFTITHGSTSNSGRFIASPSPGQQHTPYLGTCDNMGASHVGLAGNNLIEPQSSGIWPVIVQDAQTNNAAPVSALFMIDDYGYPDWSWSFDNGTGGTGRVNTSVVRNNVNGQNLRGMYAYDYCLYEFLALGMGSAANLAEITEGDGSLCAVAFGRNESRQWCMKNLPILPQYGDHQLTNDFGYVAYQADQTAMTRTSTDIPDLDGIGTNARTWGDIWDAVITGSYDHFFKPLQGPSIGVSDIEANHWGIQLGDIYFVAPDGLYNATGDSADGGTQLITTLFGDQQVADLKAALVGTSADWKVIASPVGYKSLATPPDTGTVINKCCNWPFHEMQPTEFNALFDAPGIADLYVSGDYHHMWAGVDSELTFIYSGTTNGSQNVDAVPSDNNGVTVLYDADAWASKADASNIQGFGVVKLEMTNTLRAYCVNGKWNDNFIQDTSKVFDGSGNMADLKYSEAADSGEAQAHVLDGSEIVSMTNRAGTTPAERNIGKTNAELQKLYADLGNEIEVIPGEITARTSILKVDAGVGHDGSNGTLSQLQDTQQVGLSSYRIRVMWSRATATFALNVSAVYGATSGDRWFGAGGPGDGVVYPINGALSGFADLELTPIDSDTCILAITNATPPDAPVNDVTPYYYVKKTNGTPITDTAFIGAYLFQDNWGDEDSVVIDYVSVEKIDPRPKQTAIGLSDFPSLKQALFPSAIKDSVTWPFSVTTGAQLNSTPGKFWVSNGVGVGFSNIPTNNLSTMTGDYHVPASGKTQFIIAVFNNAGNILSAANIVLGNVTADLITLPFGQAIASNQVFLINNGRDSSVGNNNIPADDKYMAAAWEIPPPDGVVKPILHLILEDGTYQSYTSGSAMAAGDLIAWPSMFNAGGSAVLDMLLWFEFAVMLDDVEDAMIYMANHPGVGPYPGWHSAT